MRPVAVVLYAALIGLLLSSYVSPLRQIVEDHSRISSLRQSIQQLGSHNARQEAQARALKTSAGIERVARERYGMVKPGEKVYMIRERNR
jgi:cell division protein FtsB